MPRATLNDNDRAKWVSADAGLYAWWKSTQRAKRAFIKDHRAAIDEIIKQRLIGAPAAFCLLPRKL